MVKTRYLGPPQALSMKLKRAAVDLHEEKRSLAPGGTDFARLEALLHEINATHLAIFKTLAREPLPMHVCGVVQTSKKPPA